ncbi:MAG: hypothetical protein U0625_07110 [Phycisphaerales bacterium]
MTLDPNNDLVRVGVFRGKIYRFMPPRFTLLAALLLPVIVALATGRWIHLAAVPLGFIAVTGAAPNLNIGNGLIVWLGLVALAVVAVPAPQVAVPLAAWMLAVWLMGSIEMCITKVPALDFPDPVAAPERDWGEFLGVRVFSLGLIAALVLWLWYAWSRG